MSTRSFGFCESKILARSYKIYIEPISKLEAVKDLLTLSGYEFDEETKAVKKLAKNRGNTKGIGRLSEPTYPFCKN